MRTVAVELKALVANYVAGMQQSERATKQNAQQILALSKAELDFRSAVDQATAAVKANGTTLDKSTAQGRANQAALDQIATSSRQYRATLISQGASQKDINAATEQGRRAWLATASAMGMGEQQAKKLSGALFAASRVLADHRAELSAVGTTLGVVGAGMILVAGKAVKEYADFDRQMSAVAATGDEARASLDGLRQTALEAGAATQYSATEAAQGVTNLLKAGVQAEDVIGGGLAGALNLAAAGEMSVADAAEVAANTLNQFGLKGSDVSHVADLLVAGANAASGEVSDMAAALNNVGSVAHASNLTLEETVGFLTEMAYSGKIGAEAGTQMKSMLMQLQSPSEKQKQALDDLNLSLYDNAGKTKALTQFIDDYRSALDQTTSSGKKLTEAERANYNAIIFGSYGIQAATVAYQQAGGSLQQWIDRINQQGIAQRQAAQLTDNLAGDVERLGGSLDTVFIQSGGGANDVLRQMAQGANALVDGIGQIPGPLLSIAAAITGSGGLATLGVAGIAKLGSTVLDARDNFKALGFSAKTAKLAVGGVGTALAIGTIALMAWADAQAQAKANADDFASTLIVIDDKVVSTSATMQAVNEKLAETQTLFGWGPDLMSLMDTVGVSAKDAQGYLAGEADAVDRVNQAMQQYVRDNPLFGSTPTTMLKQGLDGLRGSMTEAERVTLQKSRADKEADSSARSYTEAVAQQKAATEGSTDATVANADAVNEWIKTQWAAADAALSLSGSYTGFERLLDTTAAATRKLIKATKDKTDLTDLDTKAGQDAKDILDQIAAGTLAHVKAMQKAQEPLEKQTAEIERGRQALVKQARQMGFTEGAIADLVSKYDLLPENVSTTVGEDGASEAETRINDLFAAIKKLPKSQRADILSTFNSKGIEAAEAALNKIGKKVVHPKVDPQLTKSTLYVKVVRGSGGSGGGRADLDRDSARGNMYVDQMSGVIRQFALGGFGMPQVRPFQGADGVTWGERNSGPWEAFISGAPQNHDRSVAIWRETGRRLGASREADQARFADGAVLSRHEMPSYMASGAVITNNSFYSDVTDRVAERPVHVEVRNYYPQAEPTSRTVNRALETAAALGRF